MHYTIYNMYYMSQRMKMVYHEIILVKYVDQFCFYKVKVKLMEYFFMLNLGILDIIVFAHYLKRKSSLQSLISVVLSNRIYWSFIVFEKIDFLCGGEFKFGIDSWNRIFAFLFLYYVFYSSVIENDLLFLLFDFLLKITLLLTIICIG